MKRNILIVALISISLVGCCKIKQSKNLYKAVILNSSEYKLLLNPDTFGEYNTGFEKYWSIIKEVAAEQNILIIKNAIIYTNEKYYFICP